MANALLAAAEARAERAQADATEQQSRITPALRPYAGQEYNLSVRPDSEPESLLCCGPPQAEREVASGEWRVESGEWRVESGEWRGNDARESVTVLPFIPLPYFRFQTTDGEAATTL